MPTLAALLHLLTRPVPIPDKKKKFKVNFYFRTSLWCLKRFYEGLKGKLSEMHGRSELTL